MDAELQILCFSSPRPFASSPGRYVHLDLALLVLLLDQVLGVLEVYLVERRKSGREDGGGCRWDG